MASITLTVFKAFWLLIACLSSVWAAGDGNGAGLLFELFPPVVNFLIFVGILYWVLRKPIKNYFNRLGERVINSYERAVNRKWEADAKLYESEGKMEAFPEEVSRIQQQTEDGARDFESRYKGEVENKIVKLKENSQARIKAEVASLTNELSGQLVESVVSKTKSLFDKDKAMRSRATKKLMKDLSQ